MLNNDVDTIVSACQSHHAIGSPMWWQNIRHLGTPIQINQTQETETILLLWRGRQVDKNPIAEVYVDINGVTDHRSFTMSKMTHIPNTDVWYFIVNIPATWRGSYSLIPVERALKQPDYQGPPDVKTQAHRQWLGKIFSLAVSDPFNPSALIHTQWGVRHTPHAGYKAQAQEEWSLFDAQQGQSMHGPIETFIWNSKRLMSSRDIWLYTTEDPVTPSRAELPMVLVLDGRFWSKSLPAFDALYQATKRGRLPAALYVFIDEGKQGGFRVKDFGCNPDFWHAIDQELFPILRKRYPFSQKPHDICILGQSLGGLAAMYAVLNWPEKYANAVCQSSSFWWPDYSLLKPPSQYLKPVNPNLLTEMSRSVSQGLGDGTQLNLFIEVGDKEDFMIDHSLDMYQQLKERGHHVHYRCFSGGHDRLCWRGGLIDGLEYVLNR